jgi:hypothetical protein
MAEPRGNWLWTLLRKDNRKKLDKIEQNLVKGASEKREFAGDPNQAKHLWIKTRNR